MTPSQERQIFKTITALLDANADMDAKQQEEIGSLKKRITALEIAAKPKDPVKVVPIKTNWRQGSSKLKE